MIPGDRVHQNRTALETLVRRTSRHNVSAGFTLVELMIVTGITALISVVVVFKFSSFDSTVLLKSLAYDVAGTIRQTQVYSVSVLGGQTGSEEPYGLSFAPGKEYFLFQDDDNDPPEFDSSDTNEFIDTFKIGRSMEITDVCVHDGADKCVSDTPDFDGLDVSFKRPDFDAIFHAVGTAGITDSSISSAKIVVGSPAASETERWEVEISLLGQITVNYEPIVP